MQRWIFWSFLNVSEFSLIYSSRDIETFEISSYKAWKKRHYLGTSSFLGGIHKLKNILNQFLWLFLGINQLSTVSDSRDMDFGPNLS